MLALLRRRGLPTANPCLFTLQLLRQRRQRVPMMREQMLKAMWGTVAKVRTTPPIPKRRLGTGADDVRSLATARRRRVISSRLTPPDGGDGLRQLNPSAAAPFLYSVSPILDRLLLYASADDAPSDSDGDRADAIGIRRDPSFSMLQCVYPLSGNDCGRREHISAEDLDLIRSSVSDLG